MSAVPKVPSAVVYLERADGRVLAVPRKGEDGLPDYADWHLPGGKWEPRDGEAGNVLDDLTIEIGSNLRATAIRELIEETGIHVDRSQLRAVHRYVTRSGRPVVLYVAEGVMWVPERFPLYPDGMPAWVPTAALTLPWCRLGPEAEIIFRAVAEDRVARRRGGS